MTRQFSEDHCSDIDECKGLRDFCKGNLQCTNTVGSYFCGCWDGYETVVTSNLDLTKKIPGCQDIDECINHNICPVNSICQNTAGSYACLCNAGFRGDLCTDFDECTLNNTCHVNATCSNSQGSFKCNCKLGYHGNGETCKIGHCDDRSCPTNSKCRSPTTDQCECEQGFGSAGNDKTFCVDVDECDSCDKNADCENTIGSFSCSCQPGYFGNGLSCFDLNECDTDAHKCTKETTCTNTDGSFTCCYINGTCTNTRQGSACSDDDEDSEVCDLYYQTIFRRDIILRL